jgi:phage gp46-like protein
MARELRINWDTELQEGDILFQDGDFEAEPGLQTAVLISLFTDRHAEETDELDDIDDKRGWWGDQIDVIAEGDEIGSRLWLLERQVIRQNTLVKIQQYDEEALQWMIDDGVVADINVIVERMEYPDDDKIAHKIELFKIDGNTEVFEFDDLWEGQFNGIQ